MRERSVLGWSPSTAAAFPSPSIRQPQRSRTTVSSLNHPPSEGAQAEEQAQQGDDPDQLDQAGGDERQ